MIAIPAIAFLSLSPFFTGSRQAASTSDVSSRLLIGRNRKRASLGCSSASLDRMLPSRVPGERVSDQNIHQLGL